MSIQTRSLALLLILICLHPGAMAASKPLELRWNEIAPLISGHSVEIDLSDGATVKGEAVAVRDEVLVMEVKNSSKPKTYSKGTTSIPRNLITTIQLRRTRGSGGRIIGTVLGVLGGLSFGGGVALQTESKGGAAVLFVAITTGLAAGGYYAGKAFDRRTTLIKVVP